MDTETRLRLVTRDLQEIITVDDLRNLLETNDSPRGYVGFEPSGIMHAGTGLLVGKKMRDYVDAGFHLGLAPCFSRTRVALPTRWRR